MGARRPSLRRWYAEAVMLDTESMLPVSNIGRPEGPLSDAVAR